ncbi:MAG: SUMF1/EgtB/PvdO family nonheme iron enzyme [Alphaproteobacteria bacterium]|nr:SUMF1/EgtB/PvdO family nonheme iron enzyme [Alphaproteobacteria bacterium]
MEPFWEQARARLEDTAEHVFRRILEALSRSPEDFPPEGTSKARRVQEVLNAHRASWPEPEAARRLFEALQAQGLSVPDPGPVPGGRPRFVVALLAVRAELAEAQDQLAARLGQLPAVKAVRCVDAEAPSAPEGVDLELVLIAGRTGGTTALAEALERGALGVGLERVRPDKRWREELWAAEDLKEALPGAPDVPTLITLALQAARERLAELAEAAPGETPLLQGWEPDYLELRLDHWRAGRQSGVATLAGNERLNRRALYVPLHATTELAWLEGERLHIDLRGGDLPRDRSDREDRSPVPLERALCEPTLRVCVVRGAPGGGKTVLLQHLAMALAEQHLWDAGRLDEVSPHALDLERLSQGHPLRPIPIFLEASALAAQLAERSGQQGLARALSAVLHDHLSEAPDPDALCQGLRAGRYLLLIDALDEVPSREGRDRVVQLLAGLRRLEAWRSRVVLTTRPSAYTAVSLEGLPVLQVAELEPELAKRIVARWCAARGHGEPHEQAMAASLFKAAEKHGRAQFSRNPMLLTAAMLVFDRQGGLPESTATLYQDLVDLLCLVKPSRWPDGAELGRDDKRQALQRLAFAMQEAGGTALAVTEAGALLSEWQRPRVPDARAGLRLLDRLSNDTGVLRFEDLEGERPRRVLRPWHRSFQEHLAACHLAADGRSVRQVQEELIAAGRLQDEAWTDALRFLAGVLAGQDKRRFLDWVEGLEAAAAVEAGALRGRCLALLAAALWEYGEAVAGLAWVKAFPQRLVEVYWAEGAAWRLKDRVLALEALGGLGDPRLEEPLWVEVPGGSFVMGRDQDAFQAAPRVRVQVSPFRIAWRPAVVRDYAAYLEATGARRPRNWDSQRFHPNRPVTDVSWHDAVAFCAWASKAWELPEGHVVRLPSEAEWEFVAAGEQGRIYPWDGAEPGGPACDPGRGDQARANVNGADKDPLGVTPIGAFPLGRLSLGRRPLVDMGGDVWEWCGDAWRDAKDVDAWRQADGPPFLMDDPAVSSRVLRGGSWIHGSRYLRCADRFGSLTVNRLDRLGFRVVLVRPPAP